MLLFHFSMEEINKFIMNSKNLKFFTIAFFLILIVICNVLILLSKDQYYRIIQVDNLQKHEISHGLKNSPVLLSKKNSVFLYCISLADVVENFDQSNYSITYYSKFNKVTSSRMLGSRVVVTEPYEYPNIMFSYVPELTDMLMRKKGSDYYIVIGNCWRDNKTYCAIHFPDAEKDDLNGFGVLTKLPTPR